MLTDNTYLTFSMHGDKPSTTARAALHPAASPVRGNIPRTGKKLLGELIVWLMESAAQHE
jgi:hypothetical protein